MGILTCAEIIEQGVELAGVTYDATDTKPFLWLKQWLRSVALGWPWAEVTNGADLTLAAGAYSALIGGAGPAAAGVDVFRVLFPLKLIVGEGYLPKDITQQPFTETIFQNTIPTGVPDKAAYTRNFLNDNKTAIIFNKKAKETYTIQVVYHYDPAASMLVSEIPWYQNDDTMIQAIAFKTAEYHNGKDDSITGAFGEALSIALRNDKVKFGNIENFTTKLNRTPRMT